VVFVCKSEWLKQYLTSKISNEFVTISTIDSAQVDMRRLGVDKYEVLIVDEGQDLFNVSDIDKLDNLLAGELDKGEWYIFHDANHQALKVVDKDVLKFLNDIPHTEIPLITNCRNTNPILKYVENLLDVDMGKKDELNGPKVIQTFTSSETNTLENTINQLLTNGVPPSHITLLSKLEYAKSSATLLSDKLQSKIVQLDDYSIRNFPSNEMSFAEIENFKGLENEVIILIDLPKPDKNIKKDKALYYVAMSRAKGLLNIIYTN
jgi:DNA helicase IV